MEQVELSSMMGSLEPATDVSVDDRLAVAAAAARHGDVAVLDATLPGLILDLRHSPNRLFPVADALVSRGEFGRAEGILSRLLENLPNDYQVNAFYARIPFRQANWAEAICRLRALAGKFPDSPQPLSDLANAL